MKYGSQSEVGKIESILLKHPKNAFASQEQVDSQWQELNYLSKPDYDKCLDEYDSFVELLGLSASSIHFLPAHTDTGLDSMYMHDPVVITAKGAILCNMGKAARAAEPEAVGEFLKSIGVPILGEITGDGRLEGGDVVWLDERTLAVGHGYRTNDDGAHQLQELTSDLVDDFIDVPLPHWSGPDDVLHLMSLISPIANDLAVVYSRLLPIFFRDYLLSRGMELVEVPDEEYESMACNILALAPRRVLMLKGNPITRKRLEKAGAEVMLFQGDDISQKGCGGPTCLTRPLLRSS